MNPEEAIPLLQRGLVGEIYDEKGYLTALGYEALDAIDSSKCPALVQRQHGKWIDVPKYKGFYVCSNCLKKLDGDFERFDHWEMKRDNFCSVCGSDNRKMRDPE